MEDYRNEEVKREEYQYVDTPLYMPLKADDNDAEQKEKNEDIKPKLKKKNRAFVSLISLQLIVCLIIAFCVFILKSMESEIYYRCRDFYNEQMSYVLLSSDVFERVDLNSLLDSKKTVATNDEV